MPDTRLELDTKSAALVRRFPCPITWVTGHGKEPSQNQACYLRCQLNCQLAAGIRGDLSEGERKLAFSGHSLRAGLASSAKIEEAHVQRHLGHASAEMTRRYQRKRDRFRVNLTKAAGL